MASNYRRVWLVPLAAILGAALLCACRQAAAPTSSTPTLTRPAALPTATPAVEDWSPPASPVGPIEISYIDNCGFLIAGGGKKVLIDAHHLGVPEDIRVAMETGQSPFDSVDLILITHNHYDHFDAGVLGRALEANPDVMVAASEQVVGDMSRAWAGYAQAKDRLVGFRPGRGERVRVTLQGIGLEALNLPHGTSALNVGFIIHLAGKKLLHTGDILNPTQVAAYNLRDDHLDLAFFEVTWLMERAFQKNGRATIINIIGAEWIAPMHPSPFKFNSPELMQSLEAQYPKILLYRAAMEPLVLP